MISEELKRCLDKVNQIIDQKAFLHREQGVHKRALETESLRFKKEIGLALDDTYLALMAKTNGVMFNGMVIFPLHKHQYRDETITQANEDLREHYSEDYLFYGNFDEELYCYHIPSGGYQAIEYVGEPVWNKFDSADEMFIYMIKRGLSSVGIGD
jgi:hypothetical protein